jgi:uncharacterized protein YdiU (UPF0061 family)
MRHHDDVVNASLRLESTYATAFPALAHPWSADPNPAPHAIVINNELAAELSLDAEWLASPDGVAALTGVAAIPGSMPVALAYAGHQFGSYAPRLGDGRALLLGELIDSNGRRLDLHLKGSGRTPFARGGDGRAALGPMLREHLIGEAMHALGIRTTRSLGVIATGESVRRETLLPGAILVRVAASHLRVGTFQYAAALGDRELLSALARYAIERHHPHAADDVCPPLALFAEVVKAQAELIAEWLLVGFIHGVMNTDNMTISGETIDYGPCAFMEAVDPLTVFSSIDEGGRYAFGRQPSIGQWNLARLAEAMLPLFDDDANRAGEVATEVLGTFGPTFSRHWHVGMRRRLGLVEHRDGDEVLAEDLIALMNAQHLDLISTMRSLSGHLRGDTVDLGSWTERWESRVTAEGRELATVAAEMDLVNPFVVPRNLAVQHALDTAVAGDLSSFQRLTHELADPYTRRDGVDDLALPGPAAPGFRTFCGT